MVHNIQDNENSEKAESTMNDFEEQSHSENEAPVTFIDNNKNIHLKVPGRVDTGSSEIKNQVEIQENNSPKNFKFKSNGNFELNKLKENEMVRNDAQ